MESDPNGTARGTARVRGSGVGEPYAEHHGITRNGKRHALISGPSPATTKVKGEEKFGGRDSKTLYQ